MGRSLFFYIAISCLFSLSFGLENVHSLSGVIEQHVDENNHEDEEYHHGRRGLRGYVVNQISVPLPESLGTLADTTSSIQSTDIPVYWHVLKSGGTTMKHVFCQCLNMVAATENGVSGYAGQTQALQIVWNEGKQYVNVDTSTPQGIQRAKSLRLAQSGMVDVIITPHMYEIANIFDSRHSGRMFTMIRHPIERAVSMFYYLQNADWEPTYDPSFKDMTIEQYAKSGKVEENWMTRFLVNKKGVPLGPNDVVLAREILRRKFAVGLLHQIDESLERFAKYFSWNIDTPEKKECVKKLLTEGVNRHQHPRIDRNSEVWNDLLAFNKYDMELYMYAVQLFEEQKFTLGLGNFMDF